MSTLNHPFSAFIDVQKKEKTMAFIEENRHTDLRLLALKGAKHVGIDLPFALHQIAGWQAACSKLPSWAATEGIVFPPHLSIEQCSSEQTARYKAEIVQRLSAKTHPLADTCAVGEPRSLIDLTGGFGVDCFFMGKGLHTTYVEQQKTLCDIVSHNFPRLGFRDVQVVNADGVSYLERCPQATFIFLDPARRNAHGGRTIAIADCTPNLLDLKVKLMQKSCYAIVKLSPMLDWHKALRELNAEEDIVREIHIVSVKNECKELLFVLGKNNEPLRLYCVNDDDCFVYDPKSFTPASSSLPAPILSEERFLYEPNASIMKAGCFDALSSHFEVSPISKNSHLFVADHLRTDFHGRVFKIEKVSSFNKKALKAVLADLSMANIATRNFPLSVAELRKRLKLKDGGDVYLFATTDATDHHWLLRCSKIKK